VSPVKGRASVKTTGGCGECDVRFRDTIWNTRDCYEEDEIANSLKSLADAIGFDPMTSASGAQSAIAFSPRFGRFREVGDCALGRESVRFCALMGLVIPPHIEWLARHIVDDPDASVRELVLAHWVLGTIIPLL